MTLESLRTYCLSLPGATEDIKWGADLCFCVGAKLLAITGADTAHVEGLTLKAANEKFDELCERDGVKPAPYLARNKWVHITHFDSFSDKEIKALIRESYDIIASKLSAKLRRELGVV